MRAVCLFVLAAVAAAGAPSLRPGRLRCEYRIDPLGIDVREPRLGWTLAAAAPGARSLKQSAYRVLAASAADRLARGEGDLWDSGKVSSDRSVHVAYAGRPLVSGQPVYWKVQVWDQAGEASVWSAPARWSMGLLQDSDWAAAQWIGKDEAKLYKAANSPFRALENAQWIWAASGNSAAFRKEIEVPASRRVQRAVVILGADASFELKIDGAPVGKGNFARLPEVFDVAAAMKPGRRVVEVAARGGKTPGLIGAVRVEFASGDPLVVTTGAGWNGAKVLGRYGISPWGEVGHSERRVLPARMLRKEFAVKPALRRATAYVAGLGVHELYLNGKKAGDDVLSPALSDYDKRVFYRTYDVTAMVAPGQNAVGVWLGNGRYWAPRITVPTATRTFGYPKARVQVVLEYVDASRETVITDATWKLTTEGPVRGNNEYDGEEYDARREMADWSRAGFDDTKWEAAQRVAAPSGVLAAQMSEPMRVTETLKPVKITERHPGVFIVDMGQNLVGWCRLRVAGPRGTTITLRHAETLRPDGSLYLDNLRSSDVTDTYVLRGGGVEVWEPRFVFHGFRYVEVRGWPGRPSVWSLDGRVVHDALEGAGAWTSSNGLLNQIYRNILWGVRGNYRSIPTDCPQRDERQGWLGDRAQVSKGETYLFQIAPLYAKWVTDMADGQKENGSIPDVAPALWPLYNNSVTWPGTFIVVPGTLYDHYGDLRVIERNYPAMKRWITFMRGFLKDDLMPKDTYGDWCVPPEAAELIHSRDPLRKTDPTVLGTAYFYLMLGRMERYATLLGKDSDAREYAALAARLKAAFHRRYFRAERNQYDNGSQTSSVLPLAFGMVPDESRRAVFAALVRKIDSESRGHIGTGLVGAQWLMRMLTDNGRPDLAYTMATQKEYPGWGYMIARGATTVWELWNGDTADPAMNSGNHVMLVGDLGIWMHEILAGIRPDPARPGFQHFFVKPQPAGDLSFVKMTHRSPYGEIASEWRRAAGVFTLKVTVPPNTTATVTLPGGETKDVGSGSYTFTAKL